MSVDYNDVDEFNRIDTPEEYSSEEQYYVDCIRNLSTIIVTDEDLSRNEPLFETIIREFYHKECLLQGSYPPEKVADILQTVFSSISKVGLR